MRNALPHRFSILAISAITFACATSRPTSSRAEIAWQTDLKAAHRQAQVENKPLLLHFTSDNCVWCDRLEAGAFQSPDVQQTVANDFVPVKVHAGQSPELAKMFQVTAFPTDVIVMPTGQTLSHSVSPQDPKRYVGMLATSRQRQAETNPALASPTPTSPTPTSPAPARPAPTTPGVNPGMPMPSNIAAATAPTESMTLPASARMNMQAAGPTNTRPGSVTGQLASSRTDGMSLGMPSPLDPPANTSVVAPAPRGASAPARPAGETTPKLAMEGFCAVTVIDEQKWAEGNPKFGVVHLGKLYLFESETKMATFLADPSPYTPVLNEIDVIRFFEERRIVPGKRQFGVQDPIHGRMFFFADEAAMNHFDKEYQRYVAAAIEVMEMAVAEANP